MSDNNDVDHSKIEMTPLLLEARRRIEEQIGPPTARQSDPGYYSTRIIGGLRVMYGDDPGEYPAPNGPNLLRVLRLWSPLPMDLYTVDGWTGLGLSHRAQIEAIDADDEAAAAERKRDKSAQPHTDMASGDGGSVTPPPPLDNPLPREVSTGQAAKILEVSKDTVLKYRDSGQLPSRNVSSPGSSRPVFRFPLDAVVALRTSYEKVEPSAIAPREPPRRAVKGRKKYKHLDIGDN